MLLENTVICNVDCIGCAREGAAAVRVVKQMSLEDLGRMGDLVARLKMEQLFYLNLGEPFLSSTICQELPMLARQAARLQHRCFHEWHAAQHRTPSAKRP